MNDDNQHKKAIKSLIAFQSILGEMGFTLGGDGAYFKDYGLLNGSTVRIIPNFDKGTFDDIVFNLASISMHSVKTIPIVGHGKTKLNDFPMECMSDITKMIATMAPQSRMPLREAYIITDTCAVCNKTVSSFFRKNSKVLCLGCL